MANPSAASSLETLADGAGPGGPDPPARARSMWATRRGLLAAALAACLVRKPPTRTAREIDEAWLNAMTGLDGRQGHYSSNGSPRVSAALRRERKRKQIASDERARARRDTFVDLQMRLEKCNI